MHRMSLCGISPNNRSVLVRALSVGTTTAGGHTVQTTLQSELTKKLAYYCPIRQYARVLSTSAGETIDWPRVNDTANSASIVSEGGTINTNADPVFDKVSIGAYKYATTIVQVSVELLQDSNVDIQSMLADLLAERMARGQGAHFATGTDSGQPQGYATAATAGAELASTNVFESDKLIDLVHSVDPAYRSNSIFAMNDVSLASVRKLKGDDGQYMWQPSMQAGVPDRLLGYPVVVDNNLATSGDTAKLVVFGDFKHYLIRDVSPSMSIVRLDELYAATGTVGFVMLMRSDAALVGHAGCLKALTAENTA